MNNKIRGKAFLGTLVILVLLIGVPSSVVDYDAFADTNSKSDSKSKSSTNSKSNFKVEIKDYYGNSKSDSKLLDKIIQPKTKWEFNSVLEEEDSDYLSLFGDASIKIVKNTDDAQVSSLSLDGDGDFVKIKNTNLSDTPTEMTVSTWLNPSYKSDSSEFTIASKQNSFALTINDNLMSEKVVKFSVFDGLKWTQVESYSPIPSEEWTHVAASLDKNTVKIYVNGALESIQSLSEISHNYIEDGDLKNIDKTMPSSDIVLGASIDEHTGDKTYNMFSGMIDKTSFYNSEFKPSEVADIYSESLSEFKPSEVADIYIQSLSEFKPSTADIYNKNTEKVDLTTELINADLDKEITELTLSALIQPEYEEDGSLESTILSKDSSFILSLNEFVHPEKTIKFEVFDGISWSNIEGVSPVKDGEPTHIAVVIKDTEISLYQNGILEVASTVNEMFDLDKDDLALLSPTDIKNNHKNNSIMKGALFETIRSDTKIKNEFSGQIHDVAIYTEAFDEAAIKEMSAESVKTINTSPTNYKAATINAMSAESVKTIHIPPTIEFDNVEYVVGDVALLKIMDQASNTPSFRDTVLVDVTSSSDPSGISIVLRETGVNTGVFEGNIVFISELTDHLASKLHVEEGDNITATYGR